MNAMYLIFVQLFLLVPGIVIFVLMIYVLVLAIRALKIYISKNS